MPSPRYIPSLWSYEPIMPSNPRPRLEALNVSFTPHHMLSTARASSDIRLGSQGGSHTMLTLTSPTPATLATALSTMIGSSRGPGLRVSGRRYRFDLGFVRHAKKPCALIKPCARPAIRWQEQASSYTCVIKA